MHRSANPTVSVVIPARNEAANLAHLLPQLPDASEIILVDGGSTDASIEVAQVLIAPERLTVIAQRSHGKGGALVEGLLAANGDVVIMLDADCSMDPREIPAFVGALRAGADVAKGSRYLAGGGSHDLTGLRSWGNKGLGMAARVLHGARWSELCYGYAAFWRDIVPVLRLDELDIVAQSGALGYGGGFEIEAILFLRAAKAGLRVTEVASFEYNRIHGHSNLQTFKDGARVLRSVIREMRWEPETTKHVWNAHEFLPHNHHEREAHRTSPAGIDVAFVKTATYDDSRLAAGLDFRVNVPLQYTPGSGVRVKAHTGGDEIIAGPGPSVLRESPPAPPRVSHDGTDRNSSAGATRTGFVGSVSVVIATYTKERNADIVQALRALNTQSCRPDEVVVVIDNNPALGRALKPIIAETLSPEISFRIIDHEGAQGCGPARNTGVAHTSGDVVVFLDDDAKPHDDAWLGRLVAPFSDPQVAITGGKALPAWDSAQPVWWPQEFHWVVGSSHRGLPTQQATVRNVIGATMGIRRDAFRALGGFNTELGRVGTIPLGCEETELCIRAHSQGLGHAVYVPSAQVDHRVPAERASWRYFRNRCAAEGVSKAKVAQLRGPGAATAAEKTYVTRTLPTAAVEALRDAARGERGALGRLGAIVAGTYITTSSYLRARREQHVQG